MKGYKIINYARLNPKTGIWLNLIRWWQIHKRVKEDENYSKIAINGYRQCPPSELDEGEFGAENEWKNVLCLERSATVFKSLKTNWRVKLIGWMETWGHMLWLCLSLAAMPISVTVSHEPVVVRTQEWATPGRRTCVIFWLAKCIFPKYPLI